ncbi:fatty acyl-CoA hydrolase precursor, medium chain-like [Glandiceps talaboti]
MAQVWKIVGLLLFFLSNIYKSYCFDENPVIEVPGQGTLKGKRVKINDEQNLLFFGKIPFAAPPVGNLRFARPDPAPSWSGERDAVAFGPGCPQSPARIFDILPFYDLEDFFSEDCLYLNVFAPEKNTTENKYPVIVFIQGGGFYVGTTMILYSAEVLATKGEVVVVNFNYRVSALGYLSTEDESAYGNWGMWDQVAAMKWVKDNIALFNGDPDSITIYGQSAGAVSVGLHMMAPESKGLFHKAICQSGSPLNFWGVKLPPYSAREMAEELAVKMNCTTSSSSELVDCLRTKDPFDISYTAVTFRDHNQAAFLPVVDGTGNFLPEDPFVMAEKGDYHKVPFIGGYTKTEQASSAMSGVENPNEGMTREEFSTKIMNSVKARRYDSCSNVSYEAIANAMEFYYMPWDDPNDIERIRDNYIKLASDESFAAGVHYYALQMLADEDNPKYIYSFDFQSQSASYADYVEVPHIEDMYFTFGRPYHPYSPIGLILPPLPPFIPELPDLGLGRNFTDEDREMSDVAMGLWANFARYGDPTPDGHSLPGVNEKWVEYSSSDKRVFHIDKESKMKDDFVFHDVSYWYDYDPKVVESATNQCCDCYNVPDPDPETDPDPVATASSLVYNLCLTIVSMALSTKLTFL